MSAYLNTPSPQSPLSAFSNVLRSLRPLFWKPNPDLMVLWKMKKNFLTQSVTCLQKPSSGETILHSPVLGITTPPYCSRIPFFNSKFKKLFLLLVFGLWLLCFVLALQIIFMQEKCKRGAMYMKINLTPSLFNS